jgi:hypothetical protein
MSKWIAAVVASCLVATGCGAQMSSGARATTIAGGVVLATVGLIVGPSGVVDADHNGVNENPLDDDLDTEVMGALMVVGGLAMVLGGATARVETEAAPKAATAPIPVIVVPAPAVASAPERLPELPASEPTLRIAKQIRVAASTGRCENAWVMWRQLTVQDPGYAGAIATGPVLAPCRR